MNIKKYLRGCNEVYHTTLDPNGPGSCRIHLVPPRRLRVGIPWVVIVNGYHLLPLQTSFAIILKLFIEELNKTAGSSLTQDDIDMLIANICKEAIKIYSDAKMEDIKRDLKDIVDTLVALAMCNEPNQRIGVLTLGEYAKDLRAPHRMDLMVSSMSKGGCWHCNQKCLMCYAGRERLANVSEISKEEWFSIIDKCRESLIPALTFTGGEPTMREDLVELIGYAKWFVTRLNTNGIRLTKELCNSLSSASLDSVQVTLYSYDENIHNRLVGGNHFKETVEGIKNAVEAGLDVSINTPLCKLNSDYINTVKFAEELGIRYFSSSGVIPSGMALDDNIEALSRDEITRVIEETYSYTSTRNLELSFTSPGWIDSQILMRMNMVVPSCGACLSNMAVAPNGDAIPCQSWLFSDSLGSMLDLKWKKIWNNKRCKEIRRKSAESLEKCQLKEVER